MNAIDPIVWPSRHSALPKDIFHREDIFRAELDLIFQGPAWHLLGHLAEMPNRGDFKTITIGQSPLLILRGEDDRARVFLNSCPHRGTMLQTASRGHVAEVECPYHRWLFDTRGALLAAPGSENFPSTFCKTDYGLSELQSEVLHGAIFATFSGAAPPLLEFLGPAADAFAKALGGDGRVTLLGYQKVVYRANWKECSDNEGYHAPLLHRAFRLLRWQGGKGTQLVSDYGHKVIEAELKEAPNSSFLDDPSLVQCKDTRFPPRSVVIQLFPLNQMIKHLDVINMRCAFPRSAHETEFHYAYFAHVDDDVEMARHRLRQAANLLGPSGCISLEDGAVFNRLHEGSRTPGSVEFQKGVKAPGDDVSAVAQNDEASNLVKWDHYKKIMGFDRD